MIASNLMTQNVACIPGSNGEDFGPTPVQPSSRQLMLADFLPGLIDDVLTGAPPPEYRFDDRPWGTLALRPKQITGVGGAPNCGKTGLLAKMTTGALLINPSLRAMFCCVEMDEQILMERNLARLSGVFLGKILKRERDDFFVERINAIRPQLESLAGRLMFLKRPFTMQDVSAACDSFQPHIVVLDYLQRLDPGGDQASDMKHHANKVVTQARLLADQGPAVLLAAAINRNASTRSQSRANASDEDVGDLAAFRDSSDIEYSCDDAFVLVKAPGNDVTRPGEEYRPKKLVLRHVKSRNSTTMHIPLTFDGRLQEFTLRDPDDDDDDRQGPSPVCGQGRPRNYPRADTFLDDTEVNNGRRRV